MSFLVALPAFALTALILAMVPGQGMAMVLRQSLMGGRQCALYSVCGNATGLLVWGISSAVGLSAVFARSTFAYDVLKYAGVLYLLTLSSRTLLALRHASGAFDLNGKAQVRFGPAFRLGLTTNLTNAKAAVFAVAVLPQFVPRHVSLPLGIVVLALVQVTVSTTWYVSLVLFVSRAERLFSRPAVRRWLTAGSAVGIALLAVLLLLSSAR